MAKQSYSPDKNFANPSFLCIAEKISGKNFANAIMVTISSMQCWTQNKNFSPGENFYVYNAMKIHYQTPQFYYLIIPL